MASTGHRFIFVGGMHRSGTTPLAQLVSSHPQVSGLANTGVPMDEGQFLQSVYPTGGALGGETRFGLHPCCHLTEASPLVDRARQELFASWKPYWDLTRPVLCEKSPINIVMSRFLQAAFPDSSFVFIMRHPVAHALAVLRWDHRASLPLIVRNWLVCHRYLFEDLPHLQRACVLRYQDFTRAPASSASRIERLLGLPPGMDPSAVKAGLDDRYLSCWASRSYRQSSNRIRNLVKRAWSETEVRYTEWRYERDINAFGYSFRDLGAG
ncbi:MAG: sulfotransferase [Alphaproteobacteria bacterium]|nr:sulfotransferase [Alphaproteobacteria bacterium]